MRTREMKGPRQSSNWSLLPNSLYISATSYLPIKDFYSAYSLDHRTQALFELGFRIYCRTLKESGVMDQVAAAIWSPRLEASFNQVMKQACDVNEELKSVNRPMSFNVVVTDVASPYSMIYIRRAQVKLMKNEIPSLPHLGLYSGGYVCIDPFSKARRDIRSLKRRIDLLNKEMIFPERVLARFSVLCQSVHQSSQNSNDSKAEFIPEKVISFLK